MDGLKRWYRESLVARFDALDATKQSLSEGRPEARESVRRIARSLRGASRACGFPQITEAATLVEDASEAELMSCFDMLLATLRVLAASEESGEKARILIIEDDPVMAHFLQKKLSAGNRELVIAGTAAQAEAILAEAYVSLILLDLTLPDTDGRNLLMRLRERPATAVLPIIVLSAQDGAPQKTECFALGADAYFVKPFDPKMLSAAVAAKLHRAAEISCQSRQDVLTSLPNRASFCETFDRAMALAKRLQQSLCLAILDLDHFKSINDTYGHATGDMVLRRVASVVSQALRDSDTLARWGGEEFVTLLPNTDQAGAMLALERSLQSLRDVAFQTEDGHTFQVTFSAGVTIASEADSAEAAVAQADRLLYLAKAEGRNRVLADEPKLTLPQSKVVMSA